MKAHLVTFATALLALPAVGFAAVYKCTDASGAISYQDQPCGADEEERQIPSRLGATVEGHDLELVQLVVPGVGAAMVALFDHMEHMTQEHGDRAATIAIRAKPGHEPMEMQITFFANDEGGAYSHRQVSDQLAAISPALGQPPMPLGSENWVFETALGDAQMISHYAPGGGPLGRRWDTITLGYVAHPRVVAAVTILNNGKTSESLRSALRVFNMFQVAVGSELLE